MNKIYFFFILGGVLWAPYVEPRVSSFCFVYNIYTLYIYIYIWDIPIGDEVECSRVARKVVSSSPARGTHALGHKWRSRQDGFVAFVSGGRWIK